MNVTPEQIPATNADYQERLHQAVRVMQEVIERNDQERFDIHVYARADRGGPVCCIAGFCGLDPWFQERGLIAVPGASMGWVSVQPEAFFGTDRPFYANGYSKNGRVTVDDAIFALKRAIEATPADPAAAQAPS